MCNSSSTCSLIRRYLSARDNVDDDGGGPFELRRRLRDYFFWKASLGKLARNLKGSPAKATAGGAESFESAALKNKRAYQRGNQPAAKRRRTRGGATASVTSAATKQATAEAGVDATTLETEAAEVADLCVPPLFGRTAPTDPDITT
jgi:DNA excision repair protein ERCC-4